MTQIMKTNSRNASFFYQRYKLFTKRIRMNTTSQRSAEHIITTFPGVPRLFLPVVLKLLMLSQGIQRKTSQDDATPTLPRFRFRLDERTGPFPHNSRHTAKNPPNMQNTTTKINVLPFKPQ